jgi:hypothetical protein
MMHQTLWLLVGSALPTLVWEPTPELLAHLQELNTQPTRRYHRKSDFNIYFHNGGMMDDDTLHPCI